MIVAALTQFVGGDEHNRQVVAASLDVAIDTSSQVEFLLMSSGDDFATLALSYVQSCCSRLNMFEFLDRYCCHNARFLITYARFVESEGDPFARTDSILKNSGCIHDYRYANRILQDS